LNFARLLSNWNIKKESEGIWGNQMENKEIFWEKEKPSTQKKPKSKKTTGLIFILLLCFSIFLCLFVHELVNKLGTTGMGGLLDEDNERERERERESKEEKKE
jgi:hypothetical protein